MLPGTAYKATPWAGCEGAAEPKARQCARHLCFSAQLALSEEQANPLSVLAAAFIPWGQSSDVFKATLLGSIPGFICMLGMISPVAFFSHAGASSPQQRLCIPISSKHVLKERIFCLDFARWHPVISGFNIRSFPEEETPRSHRRFFTTLLVLPLPNFKLQ